MGLLRRVLGFWPYLSGGVAAFAALPLGTTKTPTDYVEVGVAAILFCGIVAATLVPWARWPLYLAAAPILAAFAVVALLRDSQAGASSGYGPLVLMPVFWLALHGSRRAVLASFAAVAAVFIVPILIEPSGYPASEWRRALLWLIVTPIVGLTTHGLVASVRESALLDPLTALPNRRAWEVGIARALASSERSGLPLSVVALDIDGLKAYNDTRGHGAGDRLLVRAATAWAEQVRSVDLLSRMGGDEFAILLPDTSRDEAAAVVARVLAAVPDIHCSAGIAEWDREEGREQLLNRADMGLYLDKTRRLAVR